MILTRDPHKAGRMSLPSNELHGHGQRSSTIRTATHKGQVIRSPHTADVREQRLRTKRIIHACMCATSFACHAGKIENAPLHLWLATKRNGGVGRETEFHTQAQCSTVRDPLGNTMQRTGLRDMTGGYNHSFTCKCASKCMYEVSRNLIIAAARLQLT